MTTDSDLNDTAATINAHSQVNYTTVPAYTITTGTSTTNISPSQWSGTYILGAGGGGTNITFGQQAQDQAIICDKDLIVKGVNILELVQKIQDRLSILVPDPELLEKYEALREAYEHYKTLEALCKPEPKHT